MARDFGTDVAKPNLIPEIHLRVAEGLRSLLCDQPVALAEHQFIPPSVLAELSDWPVVYVRRGSWYVGDGHELVVTEASTNEETALNLLEAIAKRALRDYHLFANRSDRLSLTIELAVPIRAIEQFRADQIVHWQRHLPRRLVLLCCDRSRLRPPRREGRGGT